VQVIAWLERLAILVLVFLVLTKCGTSVPA
jgi:hypothetical protein